MRAILDDLFQAFRSLRAGPSFISILTLAVATGATIAIFSILYAVFIRPLPYTQPENLYVIWEDATHFGFPENSPAPANYMDWKKQSRSFSAMSAFTEERIVLSGIREPVLLHGVYASADIFSLLGLNQANLGRLPSSADDRAGAPRVCVISDQLWRDQFGSDQSIVGKTIRLDGNAVAVIGVLPENFTFPVADFDLMVPFAWSQQAENNREDHYLLVLGRLRNDIAPDRALAELKMIGKKLEALYPLTNQQLGVRIVELRRQLTGNYSAAIWMLFAAVILVLMIACANLSGLQISHAMDRMKEMSLRVALGASPFRIARMQLCESIFLALAGGAGGFLLSMGLTHSFSALLPADVLKISPVQIDWLVFLFAFLVAMSAGFLSGLVPAAQMARKALFQTMNEASARLIVSHGRIRSLFVIGQITLCVCLVLAAGLMLRSLRQVLTVPLGFQPANVLSLRTTLTPDPYRDFEKRIQFFSQVLQGVRSIPGITSAGYTSHLPLTWRGDNNQFSVEGIPNPPGGPENLASIRVISSGYFQTMGTPITGRDFADTDRPDSPRVTIINQTMARRFWPNGNALNKRIQRGRDVDPDAWLTIVGIVPDFHQSSLEIAPRPEIYVPVTQHKGFYFAPQALVVRVNGNPGSYAPVVRKVISRIDQNVPISNVVPLQDLVRQSSAERATQSALFTMFGAIALLLASIGIYGVMTRMVVRRTPEIGIRKVLGAGSSELVRLILKPALEVVAAGIASGLALSFGFSYLLQSLLFGITPTDAVTFTGVPLILLAVSGVACFLPLRRAAKIDPAVALRDE